MSDPSAGDDRTRACRADPAATPPAPAPARRARTRVLALIALMSALAAVLYATVIRGMSPVGAPLHVPWEVLTCLFAAGETWRVYLHFRRSSHSFSLCEIPLVIGLFCTGAGGLLLARVLGAVVGLGLVRRHPPTKLAFNCALFTLQAECAQMLLRAVIHDSSQPGLAVWVAVAVIAVLMEAFGSLMVLAAIALTEGRPAWTQVLQGLGFGVAGSLVNTCLALEAVAIMWRNLADLWLLLVPVATTALAYTAYTAERRKHQRMQYLYQSSDLLRRAGGDSGTIAALLTQMRTIFHAEIAELTILPGDRREHDAVRISVDADGQVAVVRLMDVSVLEEALVFIDPQTRGLLVHGGSGDDAVRPMLRLRGVRDAMVVGLRTEDRVAGVLMVGNRASGVNGFAEEDLHLFETMASQVSVALENGRLEAQLKHQAFHDTLTNLANRALFTDRVTHALSRRPQSGRAAACVLFVDLDDFKMVNDSLGHAGGDALLRAVAGRISMALRPYDTAARLGGDEFAILLEEVAGVEEAVTVAQRVVAALRRPFLVQNREITMHASIGICSAVAGQTTAEELIARADMAMYRAKERGKGRFEIYEPGMHDAVVARLEMKTELERALDRGELQVHYQPIVDLRSGRLVNVEALARWRRPGHGMVPPDQFIPLAEDTGLIEPLGEVVLERACRDARRWSALRAGRPPVGVSVNVSPRQLLRDDFSDRVAAVLRRTGLPAGLLTLEITESWIVPDEEAPRELLGALKALGVRLAIDDFGTGYSSLSCLQYLPVDILKIAKPFVDGISEAPRKQAFALAIARLGQTLSLELVAEGIETRDQRDRLLALGCEYGQGYHFSRAVPGAEIEAMLTRPEPRDGAVPLPSLVPAV